MSVDESVERVLRDVRETAGLSLTALVEGDELEVRFSGELVIAHSEGDVFVHFSAIEGGGYGVLSEDEWVEWQGREPGQGSFPRTATWVRRRRG